MASSKQYEYIQEEILALDRVKILKLDLLEFELFEKLHKIEFNITLFPNQIHIFVRFMNSVF
jgi:hypothetical protein